MSRLKWTERPDGWHSGRWSIERVGPGFWVLTKSSDHFSRTSSTSIVGSSRSSSALKTRAARMERRRVARLKLISRIAIAVIMILGAVAIMETTLSWAPAAAIGLGSVGVWAVLGVLDYVSGRPWEYVNSTYQ